MRDNVKFVLEVLIASLLIAIAIRQIGPLLSVPATDVSAIAIVLTPTLMMGSLLLWRAVR